MRMRIIVVLIGFVLSSLTQTLALAATNGVVNVHETRTDNQGRFMSKRFSGTAWVDQNLDGMRQPSEPVAARSSVVIRGGNVPWDRRYNITVYHFEPGAKPVFKSGNVSYTHQGWAYVRLLQGERHRTLSIRVKRIGQDHLAPLNLPLDDGHFFKEASADYQKRGDAGFSVTNADGIPFWDTWQKLGLENVGYPISHRYMWRGFITQAFQKAIFQWQPGRGVFFVNIFDELRDAGYDEQLRSQFSTPRQLDPAFDYDYPVDGDWQDIVKYRLAFLNENPAIKDRYFAASDPLLQFGLPTSKVRDHGNHFAIRTQRAVFQQWKEDVSWAKAGEVTIANGGDIAKELYPNCEYTYTRSTCTHPLFPGTFWAPEGPLALSPQPIGFVGAWPP